MLLGGDVGGTKTKLALFERSGDRLERRAVEKFDSKAFPGLATIVRTFLEQHRQKVSAACFGIPGPVKDGAVSTTNLPWTMRECDLSAELGIPKVKLVNDLAATTAAVPHLTPEQLHVLHPGSPDPAASVRAVLAPGTGLGQACLFTTSGTHHVLASEGGHVEFSAATDDEIGLLKYLRAKFGHVSAERVISGSGLENIYGYLRDSGFAPERAAVAELLRREPAPVVITRLGLADECPLCVKALDMLASLIGAQAGNLALTYLATGGIYLGGGMPPRMISKLTSGRTVRAYTDKGRFSDYVHAIPLTIITDDEAATYGAGYIAATL
jgi:glucokinase